MMPQLATVRPDSLNSRKEAMRRRYHAIVISHDNRLVKQIETDLATEIGSVQLSNESECMQQTVDSNALIFLDARGLDGDASAMISRLKRKNDRAPVFVIAKDKKANAVLECMRAGASDYLTYPVDHEEYGAAIRRISERHEGDESRGRIAAVFSLKGGQGATSLTTNLVDHIHKLTQGTCLLADLNLYMGHASVALDMHCDYTPFDLIRDLDRADDNLLFSSLTQHGHGFHVLGVSEQVGDAGQITTEDLAEMLSLLRQHVRYTVLDLPHDFSPQALAGLDAADRILLVVQQDIPSLKSAQIALRVFSDLDYEEDKVAVVVNRALDKSEIGQQDVETALKRPVFASLRNDYRTLAAIYNKGETVDAEAPESRLNEDLNELACRLTGMQPRMKKRSGWRSLLPT
jgi:pilus assembly protein CpaE